MAGSEAGYIAIPVALLVIYIIWKSVYVVKGTIYLLLYYYNNRLILFFIVLQMV
jgi:hypothetical protein